MPGKTGNSRQILLQVSLADDSLYLPVCKASFQDPGETIDNTVQ